MAQWSRVYLLFQGRILVLVPSWAAYNNTLLTQLQVIQGPHTYIPLYPSHIYTIKKKIFSQVVVAHTLNPST